MKADLHLHSNYSDGSDDLKSLVEAIKLANIDIFALTDHDTIEGCLEMSQLVPENIKFIPSIELTCLAVDIKCHILGFNCNPKDATMTDLIEKGKKLRRIKLDTRVQYLKDTWGIELTKEEHDWLYSRRSVVKTHIANVIVNRGLAENNILAMRKYLNGCKAGDTKFDAGEAINAIIKSGGIPVWAHPLGGEDEAHFTKEEFIPKLEKMIRFGIRGLECYYSRYNKDEIEFLKSCANEYGLLITGGSDYHGANKTVEIAQLNLEKTLVEAEELTLLKEINIMDNTQNILVS